MKEYDIAMLPGDGVGPELLKSAQKILESVEKRTSDIKFHFKEFPFGASSYAESGSSLPASTIDGIKKSHAALLGAVSVKNIPAPSPIGLMRKSLNLFADVRVIKSWPNAWALRPDIDIVCVRENTEGFLSDRNLYLGYGEWMPNADQVLSLRVITREACRKIARFSFKYARARGRKKITALHKGGVLKMGCGLFLEAVTEVSGDFPDIKLNDEYIDNAANGLVCHPQEYDMILTTNLFGDIISDEAAALVSNLVPTANIGDDSAVFLPVNHQHRPKEAGLGIVNPIPTITCVVAMLEYIGENEAALRVKDSIAEALKKNALQSRSTVEVNDAICKGI